MRLTQMVLLASGTFALWLAASCAGADVTFTTLYKFTNGNDGAWPSGLVQGTDGNFYGTTSHAGAFHHGTVYKITPPGSLTTLYSFTGGSDGGNPYTGLVQGSDGNLYGTTGVTVFRITTTGAFTTLHTFTLSSEGSGPGAAMVQGSDGNFYGTTAQGGVSGGGTIFKITSAGVLTTLHSFMDGSYYYDPLGALVQSGDGNFYGTTFYGGTNEAGTVFTITPTGAFTILYSFTGGSDGGNPHTGLVLGSDGNFYGTTYWGGLYPKLDGYGTVFKITPDGALTTLNVFNGGGYPNNLVQGSDGNFYGTTMDAPVGHAFKMTPAGTLTTLGAFSGTYGFNYPSALVQGSDGNLYATTYGSTVLPWTDFGTVVRISIPLPPTITTASPLPSGTVGVPYSQSLAATHGTPPYGWSVVSGSLPDGLSLSNDGVISGTPIAATAASFTVQVTGANDLSSTNGFDLAINAGPGAGALQVTISPTSAVSAGAQWQVDGGLWQNSGATVAALSVTNHIVHFSTISDWISPADQTVSISNGVTATVGAPYTIAPAKLGTWQLTIRRTDRVKETGLGWVTFYVDGTLTGYSLTTLTFGVATYSGTWIATSSKTFTASFTETLNGQSLGGTMQGKFSPKSISGKVLFDNGATGKISGSPAAGVPDASGNWSGTAKASGQTAPESFTVSANHDFAGVFDITGTVNGSLHATGQVIVAANGTVVGYGVTELSNGGTLGTGFTGKFNASKGTLSTRGVDENGVKVLGKFTRH